MKLVSDIQSLSTFQCDTTRLVKQMKKTKEPVGLTINGEAALVVQDAESYQVILEDSAQNDIEASYHWGYRK
jgi:hypothetical protein